MTPTIYQAVWGVVPESLKPMVAQTFEVAAHHGWGYEMLSFDAIPNENDAIRIAWDKLKFTVLSTEPGAILCDLDCVPQDVFEYIEDGRPHMGYYPDDDPPKRECVPQPDTFLCWGPCEWWQSQIDAGIARHMLDVSCWPRKLLRDNKDIVQIPKAQYIHFMFTAKGDK